MNLYKLLFLAITFLFVLKTDSFAQDNWILFDTAATVTYYYDSSSVIHYDNPNSYTCLIKAVYQKPDTSTVLKKYAEFIIAEFRMYCFKERYKQEEGYTYYSDKSSEPLKDDNPISYIAPGSPGSILLKILCK